MKSRLSLNKVGKVSFNMLLAFTAFLKLSPYFVWSTYLNGRFILFVFLITSVSVALCAFKIVQAKKVLAPKLLSGLLFFLFGIVVVALSQSSLSGKVSSFVSYLCITLFIMQRTEVQQDVFRYFMWIFALSLIPTIVLATCQFLGISFSFKILDPTNPAKLAANHYYEQYFLAVIYRTSEDARYCGMFDEPGVVGTFSALFLAANGFPSRRINSSASIVSNIILMISGILSASLAFILLVSVIVLLYFLIVKSNKKVLYFLPLLSATLVLIYIPSNIGWVSSIQSLLRDGITRSRVTPSFELAFEAFLEGDAFRVLFGNGFLSAQQNPGMFGSAEWRILIYDFGFIGFIVILSWIVLSVYGTYRKAGFLPTQFILLSVFLLSMYQRQYVFSIDYMFILFGGAAFLAKPCCFLPITTMTPSNYIIN